MDEFNASITFDRRLYRQHITGSIAHVTMLAKQRILTDGEKDAIIAGLERILADLDDGSFTIDESCEDIHSFVEATLIKRIGDVGKNSTLEEAATTRWR